MIEIARLFWSNALVKIIIFDDKNIAVSNKNNIWKVTDIHSDGNKLQLENCNDPALKIPNISACKVEKIEKYNINYLK